MDAFLVHFKVLSLMFDLILPLDVDWIERQWRLLPASPDNPKTVYRVAFRQTWPRLLIAHSAHDSIDRLEWKENGLSASGVLPALPDSPRTIYRATSDSPGLRLVIAKLLVIVVLDLLVLFARYLSNLFLPCLLPCQYCTMHASSHEFAAETAFELTIPAENVRHCMREKKKKTTKIKRHVHLVHYSLIF